MKQKRYIYGIVGCLLISMMLGISSFDGLEDELFQKNSYIVHNGWQDYALEVAGTERRTRNGILDGQ